MSQDDLEIDLDAIQRRMDGAMNALMAYLTDNCCGGISCGPANACSPAITEEKAVA